MKKVLFPGLHGEMARRGETQQELAKLIDITEQAISKKFTGKTQWKFNEIEILCEHFNKNYDELFKNNEEQKSN